MAWVLALVLSSVAAGAAAGPSPEGLKRLLVLPLEPRAGLTPEETASVSDFMVAESRRLPGYRVMAQADLEQMLSHQAREQLLGCDSTGCLAELGGALDADEVLFGSVGRLGERDLVLTLTRIGPRTSTTLGGEAERVKGSSADAMLDAVPRLLKRLYPAYEPPEPRVHAVARPLLVGLLSAAGGVVQYASFASMFTSVLLVPCPALALTSACGAGCACCAAPWYGSAIQAWLSDLVGRRQAGFRRAAVVGTLVLGAIVAVTPLNILASGVGGLLFGLTMPNDLRAKRKAVDALVALFIPIRQYPEANFALACGAAAGWAGILAMVTVVPFTQAVTLMVSSRARPDDEEPQPPGLYGPWEERPGCVAWLPCRVLGGKPASAPRQPDLDDGPQTQPAAASAPASAPVP
jgi:hypothetical protein